MTPRRGRLERRQARPPAPAVLELRDWREEIEPWLDLVDELLDASPSIEAGCLLLQATARQQGDPVLQRQLARAGRRLEDLLVLANCLSASDLIFLRRALTPPESST